MMSTEAVVTALTMTTLAFALGCRVSRSLAYKAKMAFFYLYAGLVLGTGTWIWWLLGHSVKETTQVCTWLGSLCVRALGLTLKVNGREKVKEKTSYMIIMNHQHSLDAIIVNQLLPMLHNPRIVMKAELRRYGPLGKAFEGINAVFVKRGTRQEAVKNLVDAAVQAKADEQSMVIFPEGTRHRGADLLPFKLGAFHAAVAAGLPVLPVVAHSYAEFLDPEKKLFVAGDVRIEILDPVLPLSSSSSEELSDERRTEEAKKLAEKCRSIMSKVYRGVTQQEQDEEQKEQELKEQEQEPKEIKQEPKEQEQKPKEKEQEPKEQEQEAKEQEKAPNKQEHEEQELKEHEQELKEQEQEPEKEQEPKEQEQEPKEKEQEPKEQEQEPKEQEQEPKEQEPKEKEQELKEQEQEPKEREQEPMEQEQELKEQEQKEHEEQKEHHS